MHQDGEHLDTLERVVVSPVAGVFSPLAVLPELVTIGSPLGFVQAGTEQIPVLSPFDGRLMGVDALAGERLEPYQRVAWLRAA